MPINSYIAQYQDNQGNSREFVFKAEIDGYARELASCYKKIMLGENLTTRLARLNFSAEEIPSDDQKNDIAIEGITIMDLERRIGQAGFIELKDAIFPKKIIIAPYVLR